MRRFFRWANFLFVETIILLAITTSLIYAATFVIESRTATPWPSWLPKPGEHLGKQAYLRTDIYRGQFTFAQIYPLSEEVALEEKQNPFPVGGYTDFAFGIVPQDGVWSPLGAITTWQFGIQPIGWILILCGVAVLLWIGRKVYRRLTELRVRTGYCLQCGHNITTAESDTCPECGAPRPLVTLSSGQR